MNKVDPHDWALVGFMAFVMGFGLYCGLPENLEPKIKDINTNAGPDIVINDPVKERLEKIIDDLSGVGNGIDIVDEELAWNGTYSMVTPIEWALDTTQEMIIQVIYEEPCEDGFGHIEVDLQPGTGYKTAEIECGRVKLGDHWLSDLP